MKLPKPKGFPSGKTVLIYQDPADEMRGKIIIPDDLQDKMRATIGTIVGLGDGYDPEYPDWALWGAHVPYKVGDRVLWGRYSGDCVINFPVEDSWWESEEARVRAEGKEIFVLIHVKDLLMVLEG